MKFIDRAFALTLAVFLAGASIGAISIILSAEVREFAISLLQGRMLSPIQTLSRLGDVAVFVGVFLNNVVPVVLSFVYPFALVRISWTPPLSKRRSFLFLSFYTIAVAFLIGFFSLGAPLATAWVLGGANLFMAMVSGVRIHGPLEFGFVLVCVAEPLRLTLGTGENGLYRNLLHDRFLLVISVLGLLLAAAIEVFLRI
jgi:hypothetical protein